MNIFKLHYSVIIKCYFQLFRHTFTAFEFNICHILTIISIEPSALELTSQLPYSSSSVAYFFQHHHLHRQKIKKLNRYQNRFSSYRTLALLYNFFYCIKGFNTDDVLYSAGILHGNSLRHTQTDKPI